MKRQSLNYLLTLLVSLISINIYAHDIEVVNSDGKTIYYNFINDNTELQVTYRGGSSRQYGEYSGDIVIPVMVTYNGNNYSVTSIRRYAFQDCTSLTSVSIPNSVTCIEHYAFDGCSSLTSVTIPNSVTILGDNILRGTAWLNNQPDGIVYLADFVYGYKGDMPANTTIDIKNGTRGFADEAFRNSSGLTSITIPNSVTSIAEAVFEGCTGLKSINIPNTVTYIGGYAFSGCSSLTSVTIPNSVTSFGESPFANCSGLTSVTFHCPEIVPLFNESSFLKEVILGDEVTSIGESAFYHCTGLSSITIPNSVTTIGTYAFYGCSSLTTVYIPNSVITISENAFGDCTGIKSITIPNNVTTISNSAFDTGRSIESVTIGTGVLSIGSNAFGRNAPIKTIWLTNTPPQGYQNARGVMNYVANDQYTLLNNKTVYPLLSSLFEVDGVKYVPTSFSELTCDAIDCLYSEAEEIIHIGKTVTYQGKTMTVTQMKPYIFYGNTSIKGVYSDLDISYNAFNGCSNITEAELNMNITNIESNAFRGCSALQSIVIPAATEIIGTEAFRDCSSLSSIKIPQTVTRLYDNIFKGCSSLKEVLIDDSETELVLGSNDSNPLFADCPLETVYIGRNISYNKTSNGGYSPFYRNTTLQSVTITDEETEISENEFYGCTNLKNVKIGDGVTTIGNWAFSGCASLDYFAFGSSLQSIGKEAFSDCSAMTKIYSKATTPPTCGDQALDDINRWNCKLYIPAGTSAVYQAAEQWKEFIMSEKDYTASDEVTITAKNTSRIYGSENPTLEFETSGADLEGTPSITCEATATSPAGSYPIVVSKGSVTNEEVVCVNGTLTITKAPLTITAKSYTVKRGEALPSFAADYAGFKNNETDAVLTTKPTFSCTATSTASIGEYDIEVSLYHQIW